MSLDTILVKREPRTESPGPLEGGDREKNISSASFVVETEFVRIKEENDLTDLSIKREPPDETLTAPNRQYDIQNVIKIELYDEEKSKDVENKKENKTIEIEVLTNNIGNENMGNSLQNGIIENGGPVSIKTKEIIRNDIEKRKGKMYTENGCNILTKNTSKVDLSNDKFNNAEYVNLLIDSKQVISTKRAEKKKRVERILENKILNKKLINNGIIDKVCGNYLENDKDKHKSKIDLPPNGVTTDNTLLNYVDTKDKIETDEIKKADNDDKKCEMILGDVINDTNSIDQLVNGDTKSDSSLFDSTVKVVNLVSTPELITVFKEESFYDDGEYGSSFLGNPLENSVPIFTIREGFPRPNKLDNKCPVCLAVFSCNANMQRHFHIHTKDRNYTCNICNIKFWRSQDLTKHMYRHDERNFECEHCHRKFKSRSNLIQHYKIHLQSFKCEVCDKVFPTQRLYEKHMGRKRCRRKGEAIRCTMCFKVFKRENSLRNHFRKHSPDKPYFCDLCGRDFQHKEAITRHMEYHMGNKPLMCPMCPKRFNHKALRKAHLRVHTGERPYSCPYCDKKFSFKHNMERHAERHGKVKKLVCDICSKQFPRESRLVYHMRCHFEGKPFACEVCPKKFSHRQSILYHYETKHPGSVYSNVETDASIAYKTWSKIQNKLNDVQEEDDESQQILS